MKTIITSAYVNGSNALELELPMTDELVDALTKAYENAKSQNVDGDHFWSYLCEHEVDLAKQVEEVFVDWLNAYLVEHSDWMTERDGMSDSFWARLSVEHNDSATNPMAADTVALYNQFSFYFEMEE